MFLFKEKLMQQTLRKLQVDTTGVKLTPGEND